MYHVSVVFNSFWISSLVNPAAWSSSFKTLHISQWKKEVEQLSAEYSADYEELKRQREESKELFHIKAQIDSVLKERERSQEQQTKEFMKKQKVRE